MSALDPQRCISVYSQGSTRSSGRLVFTPKASQEECLGAGRGRDCAKSALGSWNGVDIVFLGDYMNQEDWVCKGGYVWLGPLEESSFPDSHDSLNS